MLLATAKITFFSQFSEYTIFYSFYYLLFTIFCNFAAEKASKLLFALYLPQNSTDNKEFIHF